MLNKIKNIVVNLPETIRLALNNKAIYKDITKNKTQLLETNKDYKSCIDYITKEGKISVFNMDFENNYSPSSVYVQKDSSTNLPYVLYNQKKLFYKKSHTLKWIQKYHNGLLLEQDINSPHRYITDEDNLKDYIVFDLGSAEGIFSLSIIDEAKHVYMFEADTSWTQSLNKTFIHWLDKITIVNKLVSNTTTNNNISLKEYINALLDAETISKNDNIFIKLDIEGYEKVVLEDIKELLSTFKNVQLAICVYHNQEDEQIIVNMLKDNYNYYFQNGYMLFYYDKAISYPYFRHGVLRAKTISKE